MSYVATERFGMDSAPGGLALVQDLLNTIGVGGPSHPDLLREVRTAQEWLNAALERWAETTAADPPPDSTLTERDLPRLRELRDRLRAGLDPLNPQSPFEPGSTRADPEPTGSLRLALASDGRVEVRPEGRGARWITSALLGEMYDAQRNDTWRRLKICRYEKCAVAFYDRSRNNSGVWHDVRICGNAVNLRASRARRRRLPLDGDPADAAE
ncbi:CGNR zinc finger domain-containing protein [Planotetraspora sp. A-T 1434]|uniref:CGNR zinc finger domain-containing protein n=1 Tax=Planotetraspora sp. A-T 1434 TaxID=2979219 RepID=UPI0021C12B7C|nr:CGNR zinc finger domain-containing protein [Planotetraspora sp. A-T 1434]MCT9931479.1 CGNR zinc finger domain-containing protein [Planotetraspora sp. A-T 1434]